MTLRQIYISAEVLPICNPFCLRALFGLVCRKANVHFTLEPCLALLDVRQTGNLPSSVGS